MTSVVMKRPEWSRAAKNTGEALTCDAIDAYALKPGELTMRPYVRGEFWPQEEDATNAAAAIIRMADLPDGSDEYSVFGLSEDDLKLIETDGVLNVPRDILDRLREAGLSVRPRY